MARGNAGVRRVGVYGSNRFDSRGPPTGGAILQSLTGALTMASGITTLVLTPVAITATLTATGDVIRSVLFSFVSVSGVLTGSGALATALQTIQAILGTLTGSAALGTTYVPPSPGGDDGLTTRLRRNQTD